MLHGRSVSLFFTIALLGLGIGAALEVFDQPGADWVWAAVTAVVLAPSLLDAAWELARRKIGVDLIAVLAMVGSLVLGEMLAGVIIAVMLTGGSLLERYASERARRALTSLLERAPRTAHRSEAGAWVDVPTAEVRVGDVLLVKTGEVVPTDGLLVSTSAVLDESALTGEAAPVKVEQGAPLRSGVTNASGPFELRVSTPPDESTYAGITRLVQAAEESKAPFVRLADRYAFAFLFVTLALAAVAWVVGGTPVRALAVLVVATPCPLILAAPAAIIGGVSRAARVGVVVKGGGPLETLGRVEVLLLDKTGTLTAARPAVTAIETFGALDSSLLLRLAASLEQASIHPFAPAILHAARERELGLSFPTDVAEALGTGIEGLVDGTPVSVGQLTLVAPAAEPTPALRALIRRTAVEGSACVYVGVDGELAGALILEDAIRVEAPRALRSLRKAGVRQIHMVTGDHPDVAELVGDAVGIDQVFAERTPAEKVDVVRQVRRDGLTAMVGDGLNDAPALALADVGIAMGARGASAASEAADAVLMGDRLEGLVDVIHIARRTRRIALQSVLVGMGLSVTAMLVATAGYLTPVAGAILQEGIDVLVILNALRALGGRRQVPEPTAAHREMAAALASSHRALRPAVGSLTELAAKLDSMEPAAARRALEETCAQLECDLLPHERAEEAEAYPILGEMLGDEDPTGPLIRTHHEIERLVRFLRRLVDALPPEGPGPEDLRDLRRVLYGLNAILTLHFAQEEELFCLLDRA